MTTPIKTLPNGWAALNIDREKHELAARATGLVLTWKTGTCKGGAFEAPFIGDQPWRPKDDDGDALRLAVKLGLDVCIDTQLERDPNTHVAGFADHTSRTIDDVVYHENDPYSATRFAIFRLAVEIGRAMP